MSNTTANEFTLWLLQSSPGDGCLSGQQFKIHVHYRSKRETREVEFSPEITWIY